MRTFFMLTVFCVAVVLASRAEAAPGGESKAAPAAQAKDPNYRWHNGQWWYWVGKDKNWLVWNGNAWTRYDQAQANRAVRSFSYDAGSSAGYGYNTYGYGEAGSVANQRIIGSYGLHSAGAKARGSY